jgi:hypothetical protein
MRILAAVTEPAVAQRILACLGLPPRAPPLAPAAPLELGVDPSLDSPEAQGYADLDQTPPSEWDLGA